MVDRLGPCLTIEMAKQEVISERIPDFLLTGSKLVWYKMNEHSFILTYESILPLKGE
jgi:hypothetical protein